MCYSICYNTIGLHEPDHRLRPALRLAHRVGVYTANTTGTDNTISSVCYAHCFLFSARLSYCARLSSDALAHSEKKNMVNASLECRAQYHEQTYE
jgi:hypothetical protein